MLWPVVAMVVLVLIAVSAFAAAGAEPSNRIVTFNHTSRAEMEFDRRAAWLRRVGYLTLSAAIALGVAIVLLSLD